MTKCFILVIKSHQRQPAAGGKRTERERQGLERSTVGIREIVIARRIVGRGLGSFAAVWPAKLRTVALARERAATRSNLHKSEGAASHCACHCMFAAGVSRSLHLVSGNASTGCVGVSSLPPCLRWRSSRSGRFSLVAAC